VARPAAPAQRLSDLPPGVQGSIATLRAQFPKADSCRPQRISRRKHEGRKYRDYLPAAAVARILADSHWIPIMAGGICDVLEDTGRAGSCG
jgi:hypothetical protein